ncbi:hypothetical protein B0H12DRAFT_1238201 [Mycena haematopus]|nr:hypothetical protein B0H12DRAFT_1238201 [Mycena haematopus]
MISPDILVLVIKQTNFVFPIERIERELLEVLDWQLGVAEADPHAALFTSELELSSPQSSAGSTPVLHAMDMDMDVAPSHTSTYPRLAHPRPRENSIYAIPHQHAARSFTWVPALPTSTLRGRGGRDPLAPAVAAEAPKEEAKEEEKDDMGFGLFD